MLAPGSTILVLDDFPDSTEAVATWLAIEGWRPLCAQDVEGALACLASEHVDAIVMEPHLRSGVAAAVAIEARRRYGWRLLLIALTTAGRAGDHTSYEPTLSDFTLVKPAPMEALAALLRTPREHAQKHLR